MGFFAIIASMLLGILFVAIGISRRKQKGWPIILIALGILFVLIAIYLGWPKIEVNKAKSAQPQKRKKPLLGRLISHAYLSHAAVLRD